MRRLPIRARLTAWYGAAVLLFVAPFAAIVLTLQWRASLELLDHHLEEDLEVAAQMLRPVRDGIGWAGDADRDPGYDAGQQRWVEVFDEAGARIFVRGVPSVPGIAGALPPPGEQGHVSATSPAGASVRLLTSRRTLAGSPVLVRVARGEDDIRQQWRRLLLIFLFTIPAAMFGAAGVGYFLAGRALAPIARLAERARSISAARLSERLPIENARDEVGELARVFNAMFARLEDAFARLARFTADASHELRTPLTSIRSVGEVGLRELRTPEQYRDIIGSMLEDAERLRRLVESLLTLSRWDAGQVRTTAEPIDLARVAEDAVEQLGVLAEEKGIPLELSTGPCPIVGDRLTLRQAAMNLLDNAIKYSPPGRPVSVRVHDTGGTCALEISDRGPGIPEREHAKIFDRFYRVDPARAQAVHGTGLGLSIAKWAVEASGGTIDVRSTEGSGSTFAMRFPAARH